MSINRAIAFSEFDWFYQRYLPITPYGQDAKRTMALVFDKQALDDCYKSTEVMLGLLKSETCDSDLLTYHLKRIDRLNDLDKDEFEANDILLIKRLLLSYKGIYSKYDASILNSLALNWQSENLLSLLCINGDYSESFYMASAYDDDLSKIRNDIEILDKKIRACYKKVAITLQTLYDLDFHDRDFVLVQAQNTNVYKAELVYSQFYDVNTILLRPVLPQEYNDYQKEKEQLLIVESALEKQVIYKISIAIVTHKQHILRYINEIAALDIYLARAHMAIAYGLNKPEVVSNPEPLCIDEGILLPLKQKCLDKTIDYTPLTVDFESKIILLSGSNMGGKTVLFQTVAFLQLLTQFGFFVPAKRYRTSLFEQIHVLDALSQNSVEGLSSFGQEVHGLNEIIQHLEKPMLLLVDELAKSTNATEAKAILYGLLKMLTQKEQVCGLFSSHFIDMPSIPKLTKYKMKGLNRKAITQYIENKKTSLSDDKVHIINAFMEYAVEKQNGGNIQFDAINVAQLLGMDEEIIRHANEFLEKNYD